MLVAANELWTQATPWIVSLPLLLGLYFINKRGHTGDALDYLERANRLLHDENLTLKKERQDLVAKVAILEARTDFATALKPLHDRFTNHEARADERHVITVKILGLIADRLGPDVEHAKHEDM